MRDYFPVTLIKTADLDPGKNYLFGTHPHGIISFSWFINFASEATGFSKMFPGIKPHLMTLSANFFTPLLRAYSLWMGECENVNFAFWPGENIVCCWLFLHVCFVVRCLT